MRSSAQIEGPTIFKNNIGQFYKFEHANQNTQHLDHNNVVITTPSLDKNNRQ